MVTQHPNTSSAVTVEVGYECTVMQKVGGQWLRLIPRQKIDKPFMVPVIRGLGTLKVKKKKGREREGSEMNPFVGLATFSP